MSRVNEVSGENLHDPPIKDPGYANDSSINVNAYRQVGSDSAVARVGSSLRTLPSDAIRFRRFFRVRISIVR